LENWYPILQEGGDPAVIVVRLLLAIAVGALVGWDREQAGKAAGMRTHMMVSMGAAIFSLLAFETGGAMAQRYGSGGIDPMRVLQGIVGGLGFLGAGSILKSRNQQEVAGLTTAASIWVAGGLGAAAGVGAVVIALLGALFSLLILRAVVALEKALGGTPNKRDDDG
jgi:putative Mg2+ transporter-C (MgtC) family protein